MKLKNPLLPLENFIPDGEAHTMRDGRTYLYGSMDVYPEFWCCERYKVFSTKGMEDLQDHGVSMDAAWIPDPAVHYLYAPDAIEKGGKTYLYICCDDQSEWVAVADTPAGPFSEPSKMEGAQGIDPAVFVDDDGTAYYYWGQFQLNGCRLKENMREIEEGSVVRGLITEKEHFFHEGSSMRKRNGIYYLVFADVSRGKPSPYGGTPTCLGYATSTNPLGPFTYRGVIIDNAACDPASWNNHGSIEEIDEQWYVFYHRSTCGESRMRRACCERIYFDEQGLIQEVPMTSSGANAYLDAKGLLFDAPLACALSGTCYIDALKRGREERIVRIEEGDTAVFRYIRMAGERQCKIKTEGKGICILTACDAKGEERELGRAYVEKGGETAFPIEPVEGIYELKLEFRTPEDLEFISFTLQ